MPAPCSTPRALPNFLLCQFPTCQMNARVPSFCKSPLDEHHAQKADSVQTCLEGFFGWPHEIDTMTPRIGRKNPSVSENSQTEMLGKPGTLGKVKARNVRKCLKTPPLWNLFLFRVWGLPIPDPWCTHCALVSLAQTKIWSTPFQGLTLVYQVYALSIARSQVRSRDSVH